MRMSRAGGSWSQGHPSKGPKELYKELLSLGLFSLAKRRPHSCLQVPHKEKQRGRQ